MLQNIGDLARGPGAERYARIRDDADGFALDDAPLLGTPEEIIGQLKRLEAGGVEHVLFAAPGASVAHLRTFAEEIMPAFAEATCRPSPRRRWRWHRCDTGRLFQELSIISCTRFAGC